MQILGKCKEMSMERERRHIKNVQMGMVPKINLEDPFNLCKDATLSLKDKDGRM